MSGRFAENIAQLDLRTDSHRHGLGEVTLRATLCLPQNPVRALMVCLHGASYTNRYFDFRDSTVSGYSFALHMAQNDIACLALDLPGMGESTRPDNVGALTKDVTASLLHDAFESFLIHAVNGKWGETVGFCPRIGVGHSMGGMLLTQWQSTYTRFDRVAFLGWTNTGLAFDTSVLATPETLPAYLPTDREMMKPLFFLPDVPDCLIAEDSQHASRTPSPLALQAMEPGIVRAQAATLTCPVLTCFGDVDISPDPFAEPAHFTSSRDVTLLRLEGSAHNHNFASTRTILWDRLANWAAGH